MRATGLVLLRVLIATALLAAAACGSSDSGADPTGSGDGDGPPPGDGDGDGTGDGDGDSTSGDGDGDDTGDNPGPDDPPDAYPDPGAWGPTEGPGGPARVFTGEELYEHCSYLDGGEQDTTDHHNFVTMYDGWLLMPWCPEWGNGGMTFFDVSDPCTPVEHGSGFSNEMRESHSMGFSRRGGAWAVTSGMEGQFVSLNGGILFWDISDTKNPVGVKHLRLPGFRYPDAYDRVTLSVFWQGSYVYVGGGDNGVYVVDASDPLNPELVETVTFEPVMRVGQVQAIGDLLVVTTAEQARTVLLDISDPADPKPIPGGDFTSRDAPDGERRDAYFTNTTGGYVYYARKEGGGGVIIYDISDPTSPTFAGSYRSDGNGGYVFLHEGYAFTGESNFAAIYDVSDPSSITELTRLNLKGDLDTLTPIGNIAVIAVDDQADTDKGTALAPWQLEPDSSPPVVNWAWPADGATVTPTSRFGFTVNEAVEFKSAWRGSVRLYEADTGTPVEGDINAQENIVNFEPLEPLESGRRYVLEVPAGGLTDFTGNAIAEPFTATYTVR